MQLTPVAHNPFDGPAILKVGGLVDAQKEVWLSCVLGGKEANLSYNESASLRLKGSMQADYIERACINLVQRHEALRIVFPPNGKQFMVMEEMQVPFVRENLSGLDSYAKDAAVAAFLEQEVTQVFDLQQGPLIRFSLLQLNTEEHLFTITAHHLIGDGWSFGVMFEEVAEQYNAFTENRSPQLPEAVPFSTYAAEMAAYSDSDAYGTTEKYWVDKFTPVPNPLELPLDGTRPKEKTFRSQRDDFHLPAEMVDALKSLGRKNNTSLVNTVMAAFEVFLYKVTGQEDIVLGLPAAGQAATDNLVLVGHCVNLLPLRTQVDPKLSFSQYLAKRKSELLDDYEHQQFTFGNLVKKLGIPRDPARVPLVPVVFNIDMGMDNQVRFHGLDHSLISNPRKYENFEIFLNLTSTGRELVVEWSYNLDLFSPATIAYWMEGLMDIIRQAISKPEKSIAALTFNADWMDTKLREWNNTKMELPVRHSFLEIFWENAKKNPNAAALISGGKSMDYAALRSISQGLAEHLVKQGIQSGDVVAVMLDRNEKLLPALLGVLELGAAYVPLDPGFPAERLAYMMQDSGAKLLLTEPQFSQNFSDVLPVLALEDVYPFAKNNKTNFEVPDYGSLAYILYTSGSTGKPKGVRISHGNLLNFLVSMQQEPGLGAGEKLLAITTVSFDIAGLELFLPLISGATVLLASAEQAKDGRALIQLMERHQIGMMQATPATWRMLMLAGWSKSPAFKLLCGGEALSEDLAEKLIERVGPFWNVYGPTETTIWSTIKRIAKSTEITIGRPIANTQIYILDAQGQHCPIGRVGEICIGGLGVAEGYHNRPELTAEKFIPDPGPDPRATKCYRTGDLGKFLPNGEIVCLGRIDFQVKIRGYRIELGEIESKLNQTPGIRQAAVNALPDAYGNNYLVGYLVLEHGQTNTGIVPELKAKLKESLPDYMVPTEWMVLDALPLTQNNKVDRKSLPKPLSVSQGDMGPEKDLSATEMLVAEVWSTFLRKKNIGRKDNFFEIGGHSLLAVEVVTELERKLKRELSLNIIFKFPELGSLAKELEIANEDNEKWNCLVPIKPQGSKPPIYMVHGIGCSVTSFYALAAQMGEDQPVFGFQVKGLNGIDAPHQSIEEMAAHYLGLMLEHNPKGPYYISGYSFGGYVAYEMLKQMQAMGLRNVKLIIFDTPIWERDEAVNWWKKLRREIGKRWVELRLFRKYPSYFIQNKKEAAQRKLERKFNIQLENEAQQSALKQTIKRLTYNNELMMNNYLLTPIDCKLYLFKVRIPNFYVDDMVNYGWPKYVSEVEILYLPGHHNNIFKDKDVLMVFAEKLQEVLDRHA